MDMALSIVKRHDLYLLVWLHTSNEPGMDEWDEACRRIEEVKAKSPQALSQMVSIAISDGGAPNQRQRAQLFGKVFEKRPTKATVVTRVLNNRLKQGIATAISWLNPAFRAFPPEKYSDAIAHVGLVNMDALDADFLALQKTMGTNNETLSFVIGQRR